ncbi:malonyl-CoA/methylmalonyl-CoA synthetase [Albimonas donghaensis]|uniref:Malonyl-CoA/methylmalonyl-CoA synthetase n=1 Tax=Albimonas donghaensis TaxID=356660 RepID=A0A1H2RM95_9RHOB|nr:malonyl-CoA synthase [Albimonas donghaensis]SDW20425.1 malonyl-CoA/methylmalonyl-CoA synthetase [Albimonas donghaensis]
MPATPTDAPYAGNLLAAALRAPSAGDEGRVFATQVGRPDLTYGALWDGGERMAAALVALGVKPGDRVAMQAEKSLEAVQLYLGVVLAGAAFLPLNTAYVPAEIEYFLGDAEPTVFVCDPAALAALEPIAAKAGVAAVMTLDADGEGTMADAAAAQAPGFAAAARGADDLACILYTSGTTGRSKGAMLTHSNLASNAETLRDYWRFTPADRLIHALPIFHAHGLYVALNVTLVAGGALIFQPKFDPDAVLAAMPAATALMGVPTFYTRLLDHPGMTREAAAGMRLFVSGSAPMLAETHARWTEATGHRILERYGMTETSMNASNPYDGDRRPGTVGFPLPGVEIIITDPETGAQMQAGETGMLEVRGPNVFKGYWRMPEKTAEEKRENGFFITGDLAQISEDGYVSIVGRAKDLVISGGYNVYPKEVEGLIDDLPGVKESAVIGLPHADFGEGVAAVIAETAPGSVDAEAVKAALRDRIARYKQPRAVFVVAELPRNTMGKVQKNVLRETYKDAFAG